MTLVRRVEENVLHTPTYVPYTTHIVLYEEVEGSKNEKRWSERLFLLIDLPASQPKYGVIDMVKRVSHLMGDK
jgi:hypothetical protein